MALLKLMTMATIGDDTIKRLAKTEESVTDQIDQGGRLGCGSGSATGEEIRRWVRIKQGGFKQSRGLHDETG